MTFLRHRSRHAHHTVANHIEQGLASLGWTDQAQTPFGAPALRFERAPVFAYGVGGVQLDTERVSAGLVAITLGIENHPEAEEMGTLALSELPIFVDIFTDLDAHGQTIAEDVRDILLGRITAYHPSRFVDVVNQQTGTPVDGWKIEFDDLEIARPDQSLPLQWRVVKVAAMLRYQEAQ